MGDQEGSGQERSGDQEWLFASGFLKSAQKRATRGIWDIDIIYGPFNGQKYFHGTKQV